MKIRRTIRNVVLASALLTGTVLVGTAGSAQAIPYPGQHESVIYTYYAEPARVNVVGGWSYGTCGAPFDWGTHTYYFQITYEYCQPSGGLN